MRNFSRTLASCLLFINWGLMTGPMLQEIPAEIDKPEMVQNEKTASDRSETRQVTHEAIHVVQQRKGDSVRAETRGWDIENKQPIENKE